MLVPIDGGKLSERAMEASIELALQLGASIVGFIVEPQSPGFRRAAPAGDEEDDADRLTTAETAAQVLQRFEDAAKAAGVPWEGFHHPASRVDRAIIEAAESHGCDLILMVTRGSGLSASFSTARRPRRCWPRAGCRC